MHSNRNLNMALQRALKFYLIGSALLSIVLCLAIPPIWLWSFIVLVVFVVHPSNDVFTAMGRKDRSGTWREGERWGE